MTRKSVREGWDHDWAKALLRELYRAAREESERCLRGKSSELFAAEHSSPDYPCRTVGEFHMWSQVMASLSSAMAASEGAVQIMNNSVPQLEVRQVVEDLEGHTITKLAAMVLLEGEEQSQEPIQGVLWGDQTGTCMPGVAYPKKAKKKPKTGSKAKSKPKPESPSNLY